ncbi:MAG: 50S ribosomal protein L10 [Acidimicrobiia bacterium]|nr:50S ribosomal protein L10 [Acidimicrobiia bacterium]
MTETTTREPRAEKVAAVDEIAADLSAAEAVFVTEYRGLDVDSFAQLRRSLRQSGAACKVVKCTLARRAAHKAGLEFLEDELVGPIALVYAGDEVAGAAKVLADFSKDHEELVIRSGVLDGNRVAEADIRALAKLPSREVMLAEIAGLLEAPMSQFASLLAAPLQDFLALQDALIEKQSA